MRKGCVRGQGGGGVSLAHLLHLAATSSAPPRPRGSKSAHSAKPASRSRSSTAPPPSRRIDSCGSGRCGACVQRAKGAAVRTQGRGRGGGRLSSPSSPARSQALRGPSRCGGATRRGCRRHCRRCAAIGKPRARRCRGATAAAARRWPIQAAASQRSIGRWVGSVLVVFFSVATSFPYTGEVSNLI